MQEYDDFLSYYIKWVFKIHRIKLNPAQERGNQFFGANFKITLFDSVRIVAGGLLYPSPAANLVGE